MADTIREFLVSLGFKTDESGLKHFVDGINKATTTVFKLAAAIEGTATVIAIGIARWSSSLEALYFASQRTGTSATQLKALDQAAQNLGAGAGEAMEAVEGLASALRVNPGNIGLLSGLLARLGYQLKVNADGSVDAGDALLKLSQVFKQMPFFQANQFAQQLGISERILYQLTRGNLLEEYQKKLRELGPGGFDQAAKDAHDFMVDLRDLETELEAFGTKVEHAIQKKLGVSLKDVKHWIEVNGPALADRFVDAALKIIKASQWIGEKVEWLIDKLKEWDKETDGLSTNLIALAVLLKVSGAGSLIGGVISLAGALGSLPIATIAAAAVAIGSIATAINSLNNALQGGDAENFISRWVDKKLGGGDNSFSLGSWLYDATHGEQNAFRFFRDRGWSPKVAAGIVANLGRESGLDPGRRQDGGGPGYGLAQWEGLRQLDFKRLFGRDIHGSSMQDQLQFIDWELRNHPEYGAALLQSSQSAADASSVFASLYERPGKFDAGMESRQRMQAERIIQNNTYHITGDSAQDVAGRVTDSQRQTNADLVRNLNGGVN